MEQRDFDNAVSAAANVDDLRSLFDRTPLDVRRSWLFGPLHSAIRNMNAELVRMCVEYGADLNIGRDLPALGHLLLTWSQDPVELVPLMIAASADVQYQYSDGFSLLMMAVGRGFAASAAVLIERGVAVNQPDNQGRTALSLARASGNMKIIEMLENVGAVVPDTVKTDLLNAVVWNDRESALRLIAEGANVNATAPNGLTILLAMDGPADVVVMRALLQAGADPHAYHEHSFGGGFDRLTLSVQTGDITGCRLLLDYGVDPNRVINPTIRPNAHVAGDGESVFILAIRNLQLEIAELLFERGADINAKDKSGATALMTAAANGVMDAVAFLLDHDAEMDVNDNYGRTALSESACKGYVEIVQLLLTRGANADAVRNDDGSLVSMVVDRLHPGRDGRNADRIKVLEFLLSHPSSYTRADLQQALYRATSSGNIEALTLLLEAGADPNYRDEPDPKWGPSDTPMERAVQGSSWEVVELMLNHAGDLNVALLKAASSRVTFVPSLLARGADVNRKSANNFTPLLTVCLRYGSKGDRQDCLTAMQMLIEHGATVAVVDDFGRNALHILVCVLEDDDPTGVELLINSGIDVNHRDSDRWSALHWAAMNDLPEVATTLLRAGADVDASDKDGETPLHKMASGNDATVAAVLMANGANANQLNNLGETAYCKAQRLGNDVVVDCLRQEGSVDPESVYTDLQMAILYNRTDPAISLIESGGDVRAINADGMTTLHATTEYYGNIDIAQALLKADKALVTDLDPEGKALRAAAQRSPEFLRLFLEHGADPGRGNAIFETFQDDRIETFKLLIEAGATTGGAGLFSACHGNNPKMVRLLVEHGADLNEKEPYEEYYCAGATPLIQAIRYGSNEAVRVLLELGADPNVAGQCDITPLMYACHPQFMQRPEGHTLDAELVNLLLQHGADVNAKDKGGRTALDLAIQEHMPEDAIQALKAYLRSGPDFAELDLTRDGRPMREVNL